jgi:hypothetical protein
MVTIHTDDWSERDAGAVKERRDAFVGALARWM